MIRRLNIGGFGLKTAHLLMKCFHIKVGCRCCDEVWLHENPRDLFDDEELLQRKKRREEKRRERESRGGGDWGRKRKRKRRRSHMISR